ncbi:MAG TPA: hypothetical protein VL463_13660 [Kofleriaceae bacterium]|jgi:hypothetical protein|nr:hypothetical protein [Kofleriaceae bacterium]
MRAALALVLLAACTGPSIPEGAHVWLTVDVQRPDVQVAINGDLADPGTNTTAGAVSQEFDYDSWDQAAADSYDVTVTGTGVTSGKVVVPGGRCVGECIAAGCDPNDVKWEWSAVLVDHDGNAALDCVRCWSANRMQLASDCPQAP